MKSKILILDDDPGLRSELAFYLDECGYEVVQSRNGTMALDLIRDHEPDIVLCDLMMPGISGLVVLRQIKTTFPSQRVVLMSGLLESSAIAESRSLGAEDFLQKPFPGDEFVRKFLC
ncbi:MAG: response regulator [Candidatus Omnitrophica bacterium]|nr:response regulator [Candidatus Omnitrophota bacterium]